MDQDQDAYKCENTPMFQFCYSVIFALTSFGINMLHLVPSRH